ncbi:MAG: hypothetical protein HYU36_14775 [Planctomycetes bacterium]|nr:hypothetical protein [Planctomycetota bacterium]
MSAPWSHSPPPPAYSTRGVQLVLLRLTDGPLALKASSLHAIMLLMSPLQILHHLRKKPFQPLRIHLSDGSSYDVPHPEMVFVSRLEVAKALDLTEGDIPDRMIDCDPIHITRVESRINGGRKSRKRKI